MSRRSRPEAIVLLFFLFLVSDLPAQSSSKLIDGRRSDATCRELERLIESRPKEVQLGLHIQENGEIIFQWDTEWFNKVFRPGMGITADIVSGDRYDCGRFRHDEGLFRGLVPEPLRYEQFKSHSVEIMDGIVTLNIGRVPADMRKKPIEANLVIVYQNKVCFYMQFVDIPRAGWDLLPMGLYIDSLEQLSPVVDTAPGNRWSYQRKIDIVVPFGKNKVSYDERWVGRMVDSLRLGDYVIRKGEIRAYSSVEGFESANRRLDKGRAKAMTALLRKLQPGLKRIDIKSGENWLEFYRDLKATPYATLGGMTRPEIKLQLLNRPVADSLEPVLAGERKALLTLYCDGKVGVTDVPKARLLLSFRQAVEGKRIERARQIQQEIFERITDHQLPETYVYQLEVPKEKTYAELINDRLIFKYRTSMSMEKESMEAFRELSALDPGNGHILYNLCALSLWTWHGFDTVDQHLLLADINRLGQQGIDTLLITRMLVNYHIVLSDDLMQRRNYGGKDSAVEYIKNIYERLRLTDEDRLSLAEYFTFYSQHSWAEEVVRPRVDKLDVSEDLVFYFVNLGFFKSADVRGDPFLKAFINAFTLDRERFCRLFRPIDKGGASMQLLEQDFFRDTYCEKCRAFR